ncbi:GspH/FimT family pseudopilin [Variovorax sp. YR216]|uniref:GspH/FimT family pseudopilin n=1 Tax=Variovorax sp. YR216 TaxID=1882828 RepID=UPI0008988C55|nr:GspH/FimT family pseudopilin [Variovorax sp. YR216]SEA21236.1 type IV fimbrial biogenesis protein FimT [Variovorax sp. YR216]
MLVSRSPARRHVKGFTLIELITAIVVLAILVGLALPSFRSFVLNQRIRNASFDLMASLTLARSEAITRATTVSFTKGSTTWDQGWTVTDGTAPVIQNQEAYSGLSITDSASLGAVSYGKDGRPVVPAGTTDPRLTKFTVAPSVAISGVSCRIISVGLSGVPSSSVGACP